ncbi:hypothetical protein KSS87_013388 [Heliosperma pusillum]|nr:hypothetical protein KSS87_013388 [Heliosperma pusillum]
MKKERQRVTIQTMGNERRLIVYTRSYNANNWVMKKGRLIVHTRSYDSNNG